MRELDKAALDRHITGNWGEDQFANPAWLKCPECENEFPDRGDNECPGCGFSPDDPDEFLEADPPTKEDFIDEDEERDLYRGDY